MVEAEQVEECGMQIMDMHSILNRVVAELIGGPIDKTAFYAAPGHPYGVTIRIMVATVRALSPWRASKLPTPDNQCVLE